MQSARRIYHQRIGDINAQAEDTLAGIRGCRLPMRCRKESLRMKMIAFESRRDVYRMRQIFGGHDASTQLLVIAVMAGSIAF
jgi:hypothetical protein